MFKWIDEKYRLVLINDETFQEERSFRLIPFNVIAIIGAIVMVISLFTILLLVFTPMGRIVPEHSNQNIRSQISKIYVHIDSLEQAVADRDLFILKIKDLVYEKFEYANDIKDPSAQKSGKEVVVPQKSDELKVLMESVDSETELGNLIENTLQTNTDISAMIFTAPLKGIISDTFAPSRGHYGTDIVAPKGEVIKATQKGTVIVATWSADTGHMLAIQHDNNIISFYKHNSSLLKKAGDIVHAGEGIAIIGNTGEMTDGPHLHFEMWFNGQPINAQRYIQFKD
ncbi:M23 family metallopeptidase [Aureispira anguillae]|uniref:M23 family metallopeptidase n=1 Tax=Aureispira anguillae TaxID=2864201 RepID=A0A916DX99_9BACT|nr:M23 family metallopeptidase [Aureispira anguillae]BDS14861.1 M23 family metallopeptidase [Aureispira anguillae]